MKGESRANVEQAIRQVMEQLGLPAALLQQHPLQLSGGLKRLVAIASVLIAGPALLILDEPTAGLDPGNKNDLLRRLKAGRRSTSGLCYSCPISWRMLPNTRMR